jgi:hypothetical protein
MRWILLYNSQVLIYFVSHDNFHDLIIGMNTYRACRGCLLRHEARWFKSYLVVFKMYLLLERISVVMSGPCRFFNLTTIRLGVLIHPPLMHVDWHNLTKFVLHCRPGVLIDQLIGGIQLSDGGGGGDARPLRINRRWEGMRTGDVQGGGVEIGDTNSGSGSGRGAERRHAVAASTTASGCREAPTGGWGRGGATSGAAARRGVGCVGGNR